MGVNVALCPPLSEAVLGDRVTATLSDGGDAGLLTGFKISEADAVLVASAWLVAVTTIVCCEPIVAGALYNPFAIVPTFGASDQLTVVLVVPETVGLNCVDCPAVNVAELGVSEMLTGGGGATGGVNITVLEAIFVESASLVAVIVTCVSLVIEEGAV